MPTLTSSFGRILFLPEADQSIAAERRLKIRYPMNLRVRFRCHSGPSAFFSGSGRTVNISSGGVLVVLQHRVPHHKVSIGAWAEMSIEWPQLLDGKIPLQLCTTGRLLRCGASDFATAFEQYQFRIMRRSSQPSARLGSDVSECPR